MTPTEIRELADALHFRQTPLKEQRRAASNALNAMADLVEAAEYTVTAPVANNQPIALIKALTTIEEL